MGQEGDDVVLGGALDLVDPRDTEAAIAQLRLAGTHHVPDLVDALLGHAAYSGELGGGVRLDHEPDGEAACGRPIGNHFGTGIARDHGFSLDRSEFDSDAPGADGPRGPEPAWPFAELTTAPRRSGPAQRRYPAIGAGCEQSHFNESVRV